MVTVEERNIQLLYKSSVGYYKGEVLKIMFVSIMDNQNSKLKGRTFSFFRNTRVDDNCITVSSDLKSARSLSTLSDNSENFLFASTRLL